MDGGREGGVQGSALKICHGSRGTLIRACENTLDLILTEIPDEIQNVAGFDDV